MKRLPDRFQFNVDVPYQVPALDACMQMLDRSKNVLRSLIPPIFIHLRNRWKRASATTASPPIWEGIYESFSQVAGTTAGYASSLLISQTIQSTEAVIEVLEHSGGVPFSITPEKSLLALLVSTLVTEASVVRILDFGGGAGIEFVYVRHSLPNNRNIEHHVVELPEMCTEAARLYRNDSRIQFLATLPEQGPYDIVYLSTSLQYIDDYENLIHRLCTYRPRYLFFARLNAGAIPTFVSAQKNLPGQVVPYRFLNLYELECLLCKYGYRMVLCSASERYYDQSNFPEEYRMCRPCNVLFFRA